MPLGIIGALAPDLAGDLNAIAAAIPGVIGATSGPSVLGLDPSQNQTRLNGSRFGGGSVPRCTDRWLYRATRYKRPRQCRDHRAHRFDRPPLLRTSGLVASALPCARSASWAARRWIGAMVSFDQRFPARPLPRAFHWLTTVSKYSAAGAPKNIAALTSTVGVPRAPSLAATTESPTRARRVASLSKQTAHAVVSRTPARSASSFQATAASESDSWKRR